MLASYNIAMLSLPNRFKQLTAETRTLFFVRKIHSNHASMQAAVPHPVTSGLLPQTDKDSTTTENHCLHQRGTSVMPWPLPMTPTLAPGASGTLNMEPFFDSAPVTNPVCAARSKPAPSTLGATPSHAHNLSRSVQTQQPLQRSA